jgi:hypothetical protein
MGIEYPAKGTIFAPNSMWRCVSGVLAAGEVGESDIIPYEGKGRSAGANSYYCIDFGSMSFPSGRSPDFSHRCASVSPVVVGCLVVS